MTHQDVGCPDFEAARRSRERQHEGYGLSYWREYERALQASKFGKPLPRNITASALLIVNEQQVENFIKRHTRSKGRQKLYNG